MVTYAERRSWDEAEVPSSRRSDGAGLLSAAAQTRLSWARRIPTYEDAPAAYRDAIHGLGVDPHRLDAVLCPAFPGHRTPANEHLVFLLGDRIVMLERHAAAVSITSFPIEGIHAVEVGDVLLDGWLTLRGRLSDGTIATSTVRFNTATLELLLPFISRARPAPVRREPVDPRLAVEALAALRPMDFKFHGLARSVVRPPDVVVDVVFQPRITAGVPMVPGRLFRRSVAAAHLVLLTDAELILLSDILRSPATRRRERYGSVSRHLAPTAIAGAGIDSRPDGRLDLWIDVPPDRHTVVFEPSARADVERLVASLRSMDPFLPA